MRCERKQQKSVKQSSFNKIKVSERTLARAQLNSQRSCLVSAEALGPDTADAKPPGDTRAHVVLFTLCAARRMCGRETTLIMEAGAADPTQTPVSPRHPRLSDGTDVPPARPPAPWELPPDSARVCVCVHLCDVCPCAVQLRSHGPTNTLCHGSLQAEPSPGSYRTHGPSAAPPALTRPAKLLPRAPTWAPRTPS